MLSRTNTDASLVRAALLACCGISIATVLTASTPVQYACQSGYRQLATINGVTYCAAIAVPSKCGAFNYGCGVNAASCCGLYAPNPCWSGAYSCKLPGSTDHANVDCCIGQPAPSPPLPPVQCASPSLYVTVRNDGPWDHNVEFQDVQCPSRRWTRFLKQHSSDVINISPNDNGAGVFRYKSDQSSQWTTSLRVRNGDSVELSL
jgi:hypothetical protein